MVYKQVTVRWALLATGLSAGVSLALACAALSAGEQNWTRRFLTTSPPARSAHTMAHDSARQRVVLFGGIGSAGSRINDTWEWDGSAWTQCTPTSSPVARSYHAMVYDVARKRTVLFGGTTPQGYLNDTWEWDGNNWTQRQPMTSPPGRMMHKMAYDVHRQCTVLFGGMDARGGFYDTWEWDGNNWAQRWSVTKSPAGHSEHAMAYDAVFQRVALIGRNFPGLTEMWEWDGKNWTQLFPAAMPKVDPGGYSMACDSSRQRLVLFNAFLLVGIGTWEWDGRDWTEIQPKRSPSARRDHSIVYDASRERVVLFGGSDSSAAPFDDTWEYGFSGTVALTGTPRVGSVANLTLTAANDAGLSYQAASSLGTGPIPIDARQVDLSPDALLLVSVGGQWPAVFAGYRGVLDQRGQAQAAIHIPGILALVGTPIHTAFVTLHPNGPSGIRSISTTCSFTITK